MTSQSDSPVPSSNLTDLEKAMHEAGEGGREAQLGGTGTLVRPSVV